MKVYILIKKDIWGEGMPDDIIGVFSSHTAARVYVSKLEHGVKIIWKGLAGHYAPHHLDAYMRDRYEILEEELDPVWWEDKQ